MSIRTKYILTLVVLLGVAGRAVWGNTTAGAPGAGSTRAYMPLAMRPAPTRTPQPTATPTPNPCQPIAGASYGTLSIASAPSDRPAAQHADLNLALRGYTLALGQYVGLWGNCADPPMDWNAPQLRGLFGDRRAPTFLALYWVYQWDWGCNCRSAQVEDRWGPPLAQVAVSPGELLYVPASGYSIDDAQGYEVLVLYAEEGRLTLKYTRDDNVISGYTLHLEDLCVDAGLLATYQAANAAGRGSLPALRAGQPFGRARSTALGVVIRDAGSWMDPRQCKDWWRAP